MANVQHPGFLPISRGGTTCEMVRKRVLTNNTTAIFKGDACIIISTGDVTVTASTNTAVAGVSMGASYVSSGERLDRKHLPAATLYTSSGVNPDNASYVYLTSNNESQEYEASIDEAMALLDLNLNYVMVLGAGSTSTGLSGHELDATSRATTATLPWRVTDFIIDPKFDVDAADAHVKCRINAGMIEPALTTTGT